MNHVDLNSIDNKPDKHYICSWEDCYFMDKDRTIVRMHRSLSHSVKCWYPDCNYHSAYLAYVNSHVKKRHASN